MPLKNFFSNLSIKNKMLILYFLIIFLVISVLGFYSFTISKNYATNKLNSTNMVMLTQITENIRFMQKDIEDMSTYLYLDSGVQSFLKGDISKNAESANQQDIMLNAAFSFIMNVIASKGHITSVIVYGEYASKPYFITTDTTTGVVDYNVVKDSEIYRSAAEYDGKPYWFFMEDKESLFFKNNAYPKLVMTRIIKDIGNIDEKRLGLLVLTINESSLRQIYHKNMDVRNEGIVIISESGEKISQGGKYSSSSFIPVSVLSNNAVGPSGSFTFQSESNNFLVNYAEIDNSGWKTFHIVDIEYFTREVNSIMWVTLMVALLCVMVSFPITLMISNFLTSPIQELLNSMNRFKKGEFEEKVNFKYNDEIGKLVEGYNEMVQNIKQLIEESYLLKIKEREAELNALQAQINPHFLYNMLDTISWRAFRRKEKEISQMVRSLSKVFRLSLNRGKSLTKVSSEKELIFYYLSLQKIRFKDKLEFSLHFDENILEETIPKLIIQPIVENAIVHGFEQTSETANISIHGYSDDTFLHFLVEDDGIGIEYETLDNIEKNNNGEDGVKPKTTGYAISNIKERLNIHYGDNYNFSFKSEIGVGTKVEITIPIAPIKE